MNIIQCFDAQPDSSEIPEHFNNPFDNKPHALAIRAAGLLKRRLTTEYAKLHPFFESNEGKMFGVLVVAANEGQVAYLSAFSGMLNNQWLIQGFVPPVFNVDAMAQLLDQGERQLEIFKVKIIALEEDQKRHQLVFELEAYIAESDIQLGNLKQQHQLNKQSRKTLRENLLNDLGQTENLIKLSYQSQEDKRAYKALKKEIEQKKQNAQQHIKTLFDDEIDELKNSRKVLSQSLHKQVFKQYQLKNNVGDITSVDALFDDKLPPGGTADCAAPKLIQYALTQGLKILALSEFWWGASPKKEIRHHQQFYPPCRSKCHPIIPFMLKGLNLADSTEPKQLKLEPDIIYEDDFLLVLNKPEGMLSIPGKLERHSVLSWLQEKYPNAEGALLLHRLDQATSGILLAAKNSDVYQAIQQQFIKRSIKKRYVALLTKPLVKKTIDIDLPLRVDLDDRPRQLVCFEHGKQAQTYVELIQHEGGLSRVYLYPKTGRTHQLRVHMAHELGLDNPIVGDALYGQVAKRLMLHAERIEFFHPIKKEQCIFQLNVPF